MTFPLQPKTVSQRSLWTIFFLSGLSGFILGAWAYPTWQHAVEGAQVLSGSVHYPAPSPFYMYEVNLWTLLHQILAFFLWLGTPESVLCVTVSGILGMISFQALALSTYTISADPLLALLAPFWVLFTRVTDFGVVYTISLLGTPATYGVFGLAYIILLVALISLGQRRTGFFLLGLSPAIHPSLGIFALTVVFLTDMSASKGSFKIKWTALSAGLAVATASFLLRVLMVKQLPPIDPAEAAKYLSSFVKNWCGHRRPVPLYAPGFWIQTGLTMTTFFLLRFFRDRFSSPALILLRISWIAGALSIPLAFISWIPASSVPPAVLALMPARFLDFNIFLFPAILLGLMAKERDNIWIQVLLILLIFVTSKLARFAGLYPWWVAGSLLCLASLYFIALRMTSKKDATLPRQSKLLHLLSKGMLVLVLAKTVLMSVPLSKESWTVFHDPRNGSFWNALSKEPGMLLTSPGVSLVQLRTRRPVLLDIASIDGLPYALQSGPLMNTILKEIYDGDLFSSGGSIVPDSSQPNWESKSPEAWKKLGQKFGFSQILTTSEWHLKLSINTQNDDYTLYQI